MTTNALGYWWATLPKVAADAFPWMGAPTVNLWTGTAAPVSAVLQRRPYLNIQPAVRAAPATTSIPAGRALLVNGVFFDGWQCPPPTWGGGGAPIWIQYLYGATAWRTVTTTATRPSRRWTATFPARLGRTRYRGYYPGKANTDGRCLPATSRSFVVTGS